MRHKSAIIISGLIWFGVGFSLLSLGLRLVMEKENTPFLNAISPYTGGVEQGVVALIAVALLVGFMKGKYVLQKTAIQMIARIRSLPNPASLTQIYSKKYLILIACMMGMGMGIKYLGIPNDIRGFVDVAIGSALINGSTFYFRSCFPAQKSA